MKKMNQVNLNLQSIIGILIICLIIPCSCLRHHQQISSLGDSNTYLKDSYNYFVTKQGNMVWAGALTLAWHELTDSIIKDDVELNTDDKVAKKIVENYNKSPFTKNALSEADYYIKSGYGQKTVTTINTEVKKKFPERSFPDIQAKLGDKDIISYAYLAKSFQYPLKFTVKDDFMFQSSAIKGFRASNQDQRRQVGYLYYKNKNEFLIKLKTKKQKEGVYLLRTDHKSAKVQDIINQVNQWEKQNLLTIQKQDYFQMPVVDFDYNREISQIQNIPLKNQKFENYVFAKVYEGLKLKIDQTGVKVENEGVIEMNLTASFPMQIVEPKYFVLDDTFWIILKEQGKHPYLCAKVNSPIEKQQL